MNITISDLLTYFPLLLENDDVPMWQSLKHWHMTIFTERI